MTMTACLKRPRRVRHTLCMVATRIGDNPAFAFVRRQRSDLVVSPAKFKCADGLQVLQLEKQSTSIFRVRNNLRNF